jgi:hypothetical protein
MKSALRLLFVVAGLAAGPNAAQAADRACQLIEWGYGYVSIEHAGEKSTYRFQMSGPLWRTSPARYRAPGYLSCENCPSGTAGGQYALFAQADLNSRQPIPSTAEERAARRTEFWPRPLIKLGPDRLTHFGSREGINVGGLLGYAVVYRWPIKVGAEDTSNSDRVRGLLVVHLNDGCVFFEATIGIGLTGTENVLATLDSFLSELAIRKIPTAEFTPPVGGTIVRPRREDEKPVYMYKDG